VGTTDVDLIIGLALGDENPETYRTLKNNLVKAGFKPGESSYQWTLLVDGTNVKVEFLCETDQVPQGRIFKPKDEGIGSDLGAFNVRGAQLVREDFIETEIEGERLDGGGRSKVRVKSSHVAAHAQVAAALALLEERFQTVDQDGPSAYAAFLANPGAAEEHARLRREAVATVREFLSGFRSDA
jgi:hypothetical protein